jgi:drug/metabolite transporter (DMT)-like permease
VTHPSQKPVVAALLMCGTTFFFTVLDTVLKALVVHHSIGMLVTIRLGVQALLMAALVPWIGSRMMRVQMPFVQLGRGLCMVAGSALVAVSLLYVPMAQTYAIGFSAPLMAALIAIAVIGEPLRWRQAICILMGFAGVVVALDPGAPNFGLALLWPLGLALANAGLHVLTRVGRSEDPLASVLWPAWAAFLVSLCALPWTFEALPLSSWMLMLGAGAAGTLGQFLMVEAFRRAPTAVVSPIAYTQFIWSVVSAILVFAEIPGPGVILGGIVVALSGVALVRWATP